MAKRLSAEEAEFLRECIVEMRNLAQRIAETPDATDRHLVWLEYEAAVGRMVGIMPLEPDQLAWLEETEE